ncbi:MAG: dethiobiotin synthase [Pseudomonadota bacterium]|jgi:dethiobiotin synthetase
MSRAYFITGTDTGVGKTLVTCALLQIARARGDKVGAMKPIAAGATQTENGWINDDVIALRKYLNVEIAQADLNPYCFHDAIAPHIAAAKENISIDLNKISISLEKIRAVSDWVFVEGAGGFKVPLNDQLDMADLAVKLNLPVILVVGMRLGCLNHALLTQDAARARGLTLAGWVANTLDPDMPVFDENIATLQQRIHAPLLGVVPHLPQPDFGLLHQLPLRLPA